MADPYVFGGAAFPYEDMAFSSQPFAGLDDGLLDSNMTYIDPTLQIAPTIPFANAWDAPMQRALKEPSKATFVTDASSQMPTRAQIRPTVGIPAMPPPHARFASPISSIEPSSSASARSPRADSESYYDSFPGTPPDTAVLSPFQTPVPLEPYSNAHAVQFRSMGPPDYVSPYDVNPSHQSEYSESDGGVIDFTVQPGYSFDSHVSEEPAPGAATPDFHAERMASPEPMRPSSPSPYPSSPAHKDGAAPPTGAIFNRKDLFTQHLKRMHAPKQVKDHVLPGTSSGTTGKKPSSSSTSTSSPATQTLLAEWDARLRRLQESSIRPRCPLPQTMRCPVPACGAPPFRGADAWNQRMEHVAKHMERAAQGAEPRVVFGGAADPTLVEWAARADVAIIVPAPPGSGPAGAGGVSEGDGPRWVLKTPLKRGPGGSVVVLAPVAGGAAGQEEEGEAEGEEIVVSQDGCGEDEDEDAEGEEDV
ncbi:uncharacterized protein THITE_2036942 [Thermothielavioides terrestris NRRL 8126]|uniref:C2H2-type domain-containing protein n=1 Tax=Thermothielavioides terrestris (strain ATCC 38088 / NRRL 8126) TaxID=578455 RepID=G2QQI1_THETT|nr:uncharacterized protein THITE_2036942 [Thermothielavioides terrestris NRRL 8126]AEO62391.1 hypothetical protein THITE_2036942 [Thermothielavioides terrestris NRRL 8126]